MYNTLQFEVYVESRGKTGFISGLAELLILKLLQEQEMYGYDIVQAIARRSGGVVTPGEGVVYPLLRALERDGDVKTRPQEAGGRTRIYYTLTSKGVRRLFERSDEWSRIARAVQQALRPA
jgi:PadR family transcriptional regulator PadR